MKTRNYVAVDLGAESGRVVVGRFDGRAVELSEVHRFLNRPVRVAGTLHWDVLRLFEEIVRGLGEARAICGEIQSVGVDTWGVDFALLDRQKRLLGNPFCYRDPRTEGVMEQVFARVPRQKVYAATGVQFMRLNTLYQLYAMALEQAPALDGARRLLMMPDLMHFWLSGAETTEQTIATTTQMYDPVGGGWAAPLLQELDLPTALLPEVLPPASDLGPLLPEIAQASGLSGTRVVAPACHDTASAVAAVPASSDAHVYLSSGTWSLLGVVSPKPVITAETLEAGFTNEGGVGGTTRLLKNITGLWLLQQCRAAWARDGEDWSYDRLTELAAGTPARQALIDPDHPSLLQPADMPGALRTLCAATGQPDPTDKGALVRCVFDSLAAKYRLVFKRLENIAGRHAEVIHVVGGGSRNRLLCQLTADACGRPVLAGPVETTALGNILAQAIADGQCRDWIEAREIARSGVRLTEYAPRDSAAWEDTEARLAGS